MAASKVLTEQEKLNNVKIARDFFVSKGASVPGFYGLAGNIDAESAWNPENLQNTHEKKFDLNDQEYTKAVDNGSYTNFVKDSAGYGLAQWTYWSRKQNMLNFFKEKQKSIGDFMTQLEFLYKELTTSYKGVWETLKSATSVRQASDVVLTQFEKPKVQTEAVKVTRAKYGQGYYDKLETKVEGSDKMKYSRQSVVDLAESWVGKKESDGSHKPIIDAYNTQKPLPRGYKVKYTDAWCATTWSALAVILGYTKIMPVECSCYYLIEAAKKMDCWQENDAYVPQPGDACLYDWQDNGSGDNKGTPDHVGVVTYVNKSSGYFVVTEGNYSDSVKKRTISINGKFIRGFITPKYTENAVHTSVTNTTTTTKKSVDTLAKEAIAGQWGTGADRKKALEAAGYSYSEVQARINEILNGKAVQPSAPTQPQTQAVTKKVVATCAAKSKDSKLAGTYVTTTNLYLRNDAGTNKKALVVIPKNTKVKNYGYYNTANGVKWLYIQVVVDGVEYTGFSSSAYLKK